MFLKRKLPWIVLLFGILPLIGCKEKTSDRPLPSTPTPDQLEITVSIPPQKYFVERIGGDQVKVNVMVDAGTNYHIYEPKPEQLKALSKADAYIGIGIFFEKIWLDRIKENNPQMIIVDTTQGIKLQPMIYDHDHGEGHDHEKEEFDTHIWLSPKLVKIQAQTIYNALVKLDPNDQKIYQTNLAKFLQDLDNLDQEIRQKLQGKPKQFMVFHPSWGYFAKDYGLEMIAIEVEGTEPSASQLAELINKAKSENIKVIFAQPQFSSKSAETIAKDIGGTVIAIDPLAENWLENLQNVAQQISNQ